MPGWLYEKMSMIYETGKDSFFKFWDGLLKGLSFKVPQNISINKLLPSIKIHNIKRIVEM